MKHCCIERLDKPSTAAAGLIGSSLMGAAAVMGGAMDGLLSGNGNNSNQDSARRSSTPGASTGGGFSSIFNLKSVINAATKTAPPAPQPTPSASNFYVSSPPVVPVEPIAVELRSQSNATVPQKTVQGIVSRWMLSKTLFVFLAFCLFFHIFFDENLF